MDFRVVILCRRFLTFTYSSHRQFGCDNRAEIGIRVAAALHDHLTLEKFNMLRGKKSG